MKSTFLAWRLPKCTMLCVQWVHYCVSGWKFPYLKQHCLNIKYNHRNFCTEAWPIHVNLFFCKILITLDLHGIKVMIIPSPYDKLAIRSCLKTALPSSSAHYWFHQTFYHWSPDLVWGHQLACSVKNFNQLLQFRIGEKRSEAVFFIWAGC